MKKILYVTTVSSTINAFLVPHIEKLIDKGHKVDCACSINVNVDKQLIDKGSQIFEVPFTRNPLDIKNIKAFIKLVQIQNKNKYDIVHVHTPVASVYGRLLKIKFPNIKTIYTAHGFHFYKGAPKKNWFIFYSIEKIMSIFTDILITMNKEDFEVGINKLKIKNVYNVNGVGVDIEKYICEETTNIKFKESLGLNSDDIVITVVAELIKRKNQKQLVEAIKEITKKYKDIKVLLVGEGIMYEEISLYVKENNLNQFIKMLGFRKDIPNILNITDIVGLFSYHEGLPRNLMEAMVAKKPIICTDIRGNNDLVKDNFNGLLVKIDDIEGTIEAIETLYKNKELRQKMGQNGFDTIKLKYSLDKVLSQMEVVYD